MRSERIGATIGSIGGLAFILINSGDLPETASLFVRITGVAAFLVVLWFAVIRPPASPRPSEPPSRRAIRIYGTSVTAMAIGIPVGANIINNVLDLPALTVPWVVLLVGAHFLPFANAFEAPVFARLGWTMIGLAIVGAAVSVAATEAAAPWTGVLAGFALLGFSSAGAQRTKPTA